MKTRRLLNSLLENVTRYRIDLPVTTILIDRAPSIERIAKYQDRKRQYEK